MCPLKAPARRRPVERLPCVSARAVPFAPCPSRCTVVASMCFMCPRSVPEREAQTSCELCAAGKRGGTLVATQRHTVSRARLAVLCLTLARVVLHAPQEDQRRQAQKCAACEWACSSKGQGTVQVVLLVSFKALGPDILSRLRAVFNNFVTRFHWCDGVRLRRRLLQMPYHTEQ